MRTVIILPDLPQVWSIVHRDLATRNMTKRLTCKVHEVIMVVMINII